MTVLTLSHVPDGMTRTGATHVAGIAHALPPYRYPQATITAALKRLWGDRLERPEMLDRLHARARVDHRHLALPIERYAELTSWGDMNKAWIGAAVDLGSAALDHALASAGMGRDELDALFVVSITGLASPSLDAKIINRLHLRSDIKRTPIFGVGCVGGALGLTRAADHTRAYPNQAAAILSVELCSLTLRRDDLSPANLVSTGLFGDGAAAVIVAGPDHRVATEPRRGARRGPKILDTRSFFYGDTEDIMGWDISGAGFKIVLSPHLPNLIRKNLAGDVDSFLATHGFARSDIGRWVIHSGGPKVLEAIQRALALDDRDIQPSWDSLRRVGNLSSTSVLMVLEDVMAKDPPAPGTLGLMAAMGPGFCAELLLLRW